VRKFHPGILRSPRPARPAAALCALLAACTGPVLRLDNPGRHPVFVDGVGEDRTELPFRYYGTVTVDAAPADRDGRADWTHRPVRLPVAVPPPAPPWAFPFDFPLELLARAFAPPDVPAAPAEPAPVPASERVDPGSRPTGLELVTERALQARLVR